jgi:hypothetical protein
MCVGFSGAENNPVPCVTALRVLYGTLDLFFSAIEFGLRGDYLALCAAMANYQYDELPGVMHVKLQSGMMVFVLSRDSFSEYSTTLQPCTT